MSEYQYVVFQAVDGPLNDKQLGFAQRQSTRADVSRWSLSVEYHYSSFRGDVDGLLRRGYDVYLQHTNYGDREIKLRLPHGMPGAKSVWSQYVDGERLSWKKDAKGRGGILSLRPFHESGDLEHIWETQIYLDAAIQVRECLIGGDLRALYSLWLCAADDDYNDPAEMIEPPVPHGVSDMVTYGGELLFCSLVSTSEGGRFDIELGATPRRKSSIAVLSPRLEFKTARRIHLRRDVSRWCETVHLKCGPIA